MITLGKSVRRNSGLDMNNTESLYLLWGPKAILYLLHLHQTVVTHQYTMFEGSVDPSHLQENTGIFTSRREPLVQSKMCVCVCVCVCVYVCVCVCERESSIF